MTLKEMKIKTFSLIEEFYPEEKHFAEDEDVLNKINGVVNQIQLDLMKYRKIPANEEITITKKDDRIINISDILEDCYQLNYLHGIADYQLLDEDTILLPDDFEGKFRVFYYKYPTLVKTIFKNDEEKTKEDEKYNFELDKILLEIMPYGIAADLLKMDMISNYGEYFYKRYLEMKNNIDSRRSAGMIYISGGVDV